MHVQPFTLGPFPTNGYVAHDAGEAAIVDAPSATTEEHRQVIRYVEEQDLDVRHLLLTHAHIDHILGATALAEHFGAAWRLHPADRPFAEQAEEQGAAFGVPVEASPPLGAPLAEGDEIAVGDARLEVLHAPGHAPGHVIFRERGAGVALSGDVLFRGSIGRVQGLPQTSLEQLMRSIEAKLMALPDETRLHPGHGEATAVGRERIENPFLNGEVSMAE